jgi:glutathione S-transferase
MALKLYDLAGADSERRFSPYCWRTKMALAHKGLSYDTIPWRFTDKDVVSFSGQGRVPVLVDGDHVVSDSWTIANYLEDQYPALPSLFGSDSARATTRFVNSWADSFLVGGIVRLIATDILSHLHEKDLDYFRKTREERLGAQLEKVVANRETSVVAFRKGLDPLRSILSDQFYLAGQAPAYADYAVFGCFQWARCISPFRLLEENDPIWAWRDRLLSLYGCFAGQAVGYSV